MLQKVDIQLRETQMLVLSPTRELAVQIQKVYSPFRIFISILLPQYIYKQYHSPNTSIHLTPPPYPPPSPPSPQVVLALGDYMSVQCHACIGGTNVGEDIRKLDYGQHIVSGTPGRVFGKATASTHDDIMARDCLCNLSPADMIRRRSLRTRTIKMLILDEADEMLNKGSVHSTHQLSPYLHVWCSVLCDCVCARLTFSATKFNLCRFQRTDL